MRNSKNGIFIFCLLFTVCFTAFSPSDSHANDEQIKTLQTKVKKLERQYQKNRKRNKKIHKRLDSLKSRMTVHGFISAGVVKSTSDLPYDVNLLIEDDLDFQTDSVMGINFTFRLNKKFSVATQLVSNLGDQEEVDADWAFLKYQFSDDLSMRFGRLRTSNFLLSEYVEVGYAYPWARPPSEIYWIKPTAQEAFDIIWRKQLDDWTLDLQFQAGRGVFTIEGGLGVDGDFYTINAGISKGPWLLKAHYTLGFITNEFSNPSAEIQAVANLFSQLPFDPGVYADENKGDFRDIALRYDDGSWLVLAEVTELWFRAPAQSITYNTHYFTIGKYLGRFMPYFSYVNLYTPKQRDDHVRDTISRLETLRNSDPTYFLSATTTIAAFEALNPRGISQKDYVIGFRYQVTSKVSLKAQIDYFTDFNDSIGFFSPNLSDPTNLPKSGDKLYSLVVDAVF